MADPSNTGTLEDVDSLVRAQVAAAAAKVAHSRGNINDNVSLSSKLKFTGKVSPGCTLFVAPESEMSDEVVDSLLATCCGLIGRDLTTEKRGKVVFGFFRSPELANAAIEKLQACDPPLYAELGERPEINVAFAGNGMSPERIGDSGNSFPVVPAVGVPHHTLRLACPHRTPAELEDMLSQLTGVEDQRIDAKNVAWVRFTSVKTATAMLEYFSGLRNDENWANAKITYAKKLDDELSEPESLEVRERSRDRRSHADRTHRSNESTHSRSRHLHEHHADGHSFEKERRKSGRGRHEPHVRNGNSEDKQGNHSLPTNKFGHERRSH